MKLFSFLKPSRERQAVGRYQKIVDRINALDDETRALDDAALKERVARHKGKKLEDLEKLVPEIFAAVREAARRTLKMRHFDVQLMGGLSLLKGTIAEMKTGEGKTLVATLPLVTRGLTGQGAHLVTVNDYLAKRDADWMRPVYEFFDLSVGVVLSGQTAEEKRAAYAADITYGTNNEFGFDYLRDNMAQSTDNLAQRGLAYAIIDEVDSILIDEARTPLIISAPDMESTQLYGQFAQLVPKLTVNQDYNVDEKRRAATLTDEGISKVEKMLGIQNIYEEKGLRFVHHLEQGLRAQALFHKDKDYVVQEGQVIIVDEFTGRLMAGRRYSDGLHQALEAKEGVKVQQESRTLATITFQNFFRLYDRIAGMTGTAVTSAEEFEKVYNLEVEVIPTNKELIRNDRTDKIYMSEEAKLKAIAREIKDRHEKGQPVLVGTIAIEKSEVLSAYLKRAGVPHEVLNAKHHAREAEIVARAGRQGAVTISTNMAGRGTDIKLGEGVKDRGGLFVLGTERHEARRIDNQLRGRSGRQGDPGETQFLVSMEDDVMRVFGGGKMKSLMERLKVPPEEAIENKLVSRALEGAQERVEGYYFDMRKQVLSYDDVLNRQRNAIYGLRRSLLVDSKWREPKQEPRDLRQAVQDLLQEQASILVAAHTSANFVDEWNVEEMAEVIHSLTGAEILATQETLDKALHDAKQSGREEARAALEKKLGETLLGYLETRKEKLGEEVLKKLTRAAALRSIDMHWMDHLDTMDYLRTGIGLRGYGQRDPLVEYQKEGHRLFRELLVKIKESMIETVFKAETVKQDQVEGEAKHPAAASLKPGARTQPSPEASAGTTGGEKDSGGMSSKPLQNPYKNVGRNDPCPCGSGKKYKKCGLINGPQHARGRPQHKG